MRKLICTLAALILLLMPAASVGTVPSFTAARPQDPVFKALEISREEARQVVRMKKERQAQGLEKLWQKIQKEEPETRKVEGWDEGEKRKYLLVCAKVPEQAEKIKIPVSDLIPFLSLWSEDLRYKVLYQPEDWNYEVNGFSSVTLTYEGKKPLPEEASLYLLLRLRRSEKPSKDEDTPVLELLTRQKADKEVQELLKQQKEKQEEPQEVPRRKRVPKLKDPADPMESQVRIPYEGGQKLTDALIYDQDLIRILKVFTVADNGSIYTTDNIIEYSGAFRDDLYVRANNDRAYPALTLFFEQGFHRFDPEKTFIRYDFGQYDMVLRIVAAYTEREDGMWFSFSRKRPSVESHPLFYDSQQQNAYEHNYNGVPIARSIAVHVDIYKHGTNERIDLPNLYQFIGDVDSAQSYKNLNEPFVADGAGRNLWMASPAEQMDLDDYPHGQANYFDAGNQSIYSSYTVGPTGLIRTMNNPNKSSVWQRVHRLSSEGTDMAFGFMGSATSYVEFGSTINTVYYVADEGGTVTSPSETVWTQGSPVEGSVPVPDEDHYFSHWTTNQKVYLRDGSEIEAGGRITMQQIFQVIVYEDYTFTAHFEPYASVTITKQIKSREICFDHGDPIFLVELTGTDKYGEAVGRTASLHFTEDYVKDHTDRNGNVSLSVTFDRLLPGEYTASEIQGIRYRLAGITDIRKGERQEDKVLFRLSPGDEGACRFINRKADWGGLSDTAEAVNHVE